MNKKYYSKMFSIIAWVLLAVYLIINMLFTPLKVSGHSMDNTFSDKEQLVGLNYHLKIPIINVKTGIKLFSPKHDDVVVLTLHQQDVNGKQSSKLLIKRVIGTPGERIGIANNMVFLNGKPLHEYYWHGNDIYDNTTGKLSSKEVLPKYFIKEKMNSNGTINGNIVNYQLANNEIWCMGDNRNNSSDSRVFGAFNINQDLDNKVVNYKLPISFMALQYTLIALIIVNTVVYIILDRKNDKIDKDISNRNKDVRELY